MANFPMFVDLKNKKCVVVGGGAVAKRKADTLASYGADVCVIAKEFKYEFKCRTIERPFEQEDINGAFIVVAATNDRNINHLIADICHNKGINVNVADSSEESSFVFGATGITGNMTIAVNSGEDNPKLSKEVKNNIMNRIMKIGTRRSKLAKIQTEMIVELIKKVDSSIICQIVEIVTKGDKELNKSLTEFGGKGAFTDEFEKAVYDGTIDIAVHSGKDLPVELMNGLEILATPKREMANDVLVTLKGTVLDEKSVIGTSSIRREKQIGYKTKNIRGNVDTRLKKLESGEYDGIILAYAGLKRLKLDKLSKYDYKIFNLDSFYPAPCQGIIAVEGRSDCRFKDVLRKITDEETNIVFKTERELLKRVGYGCHMPIGAYAVSENNEIHLKAVFLGDENKFAESKGEIYEEVAKTVADKIKE